MTITLQAVNELIASLESAGELSIREQKFLKLAKAYQQLAAENVTMRETIEAVRGVADNSSGIAGWHLNGEIAQWSEILPEIDDIETPATDCIVAGIKADGVEEFLKGSQLPYQIATVLADYDNADDETLLHVIWSGQPPEPEGDVWHLEYVSRGNAIVREVLKQLRDGADK
ncbi:Uncharacterised protein [Klebsiella pneumoniae]|uniref:hypothetical protein n=1 Tax=Klebsiella pneumoniae TaxID=573 RepID=UPI0006DB41A9|nr:hypothetical protein [Klebsiella pneumoniae]QBP28369.1 hypothetical protein [Klebsiella phage ST101-KPC2phi6.1]ATO01461.1 hypothetical protein AN676_0323345 [Klebsiella pneumoniae subsp. pneumoniae]ATO07165.1 hypothetical protein AN663_23515 [Klebsiella pneumoniae subsp. pneumoniae]MBY8374385.1 hypothetical protein [Klebsiella pneumoniae]MBY8443968.1 hypothetical protein [Klebsiella pneumoniae]